MKSTFALAATLALALALGANAQQQPPAIKPAPAPQNPGAQIKPEVAHDPTPEERIAKLEKDVAKLRAELDALHEIEKSGGIAQQVKDFLDERVITAKTLEATTPTPTSTSTSTSTPASTDASERHGARLLGDAEKAKLGDDVIFTVDGLPVTRSEFDQAYAYLKSYPREESDAELKKMAVMELVRVKAIQAALPEQRADALQRIKEDQRRLQQGTDFADLAREVSDCPSKVKGGDLGDIDRVHFDPSFTRAAFTTPVGEVSGIVESTFGYHLIEVTGKQKGDTPAQDTVHASHILELYDPNQAELSRITQRVNNGEVDLAFVSDDFRKYTPDAFKSAADDDHDQGSDGDKNDK